MVTASRRIAHEHARWAEAWCARYKPILSLALAMLSGCGSSDSQPVVKELNASQDNLRSIRAAYLQVVQTSGRPQGANDLVPALKKFGDPDTILVSPADGQPYVIVWGIDPMSPSMVGKIWAYERNGKDEKRWVIDHRHVREMSDEEFGKAIIATGRK